MSRLATDLSRCTHPDGPSACSVHGRDTAHARNGERVTQARREARYRIVVDDPTSTDTELIEAAMLTEDPELTARAWAVVHQRIKGDNAVALEHLKGQSKQALLRLDSALGKVLEDIRLGNRADIPTEVTYFFYELLDYIHLVLKQRDTQRRMAYEDVPVEKWKKRVGDLATRHGISNPLADPRTADGNRPTKRKEQ